MFSRRPISVVLLASGVLLLGGTGWWIFCGGRFSGNPNGEFDGGSEDNRRRSVQPTVAGEGPLVLAEPEANIGPVKGMVRHRFSFSNQGAVPLQIVKVTPSCSCTVIRPEKNVLAPQETSSVGLEIDITRKEPGPHLFSLTIEYEAAGNHTAKASLMATYQPDVQIFPRAMALTVEELAVADASFSVVDYRPEPLKVLAVRTSSPALQAKLVETPSEYLPGWKYVFRVSYTDKGDKPRTELAETVWVETSDSQYKTLTVRVNVRRLELVRALPKTVRLDPGRKSPARVVVRHLRGEKIEIDSIDTGGIVQAEFDRGPAFTPSVSFVLPGTVDDTRFPATAWIKVKKPCERSIPVTIELVPSN